MVSAVALSPDGKTIASASKDNTIKLWHIDGREIVTLTAHSDRLSAVAFSPDGKSLASASEDNTVILWYLKRVVSIDTVLTYGCDWVRDYLYTNLEVKQGDYHLCDGIVPK